MKPSFIIEHGMAGIRIRNGDETAAGEPRTTALVYYLRHGPSRTGVEWRSTDPANATARLFAAAPDMARALLAMLNDPECVVETEAVIEAREALTKAGVPLP